MIYHAITKLLDGRNNLFTLPSSVLSDEKWRNWLPLAFTDLRASSRSLFNNINPLLTTCWKLFVWADLWLWPIFIQYVSLCLFFFLVCFSRPSATGCTKVVCKPRVCYPSNSKNSSIRKQSNFGRVAAATHFVKLSLLTKQMSVSPLRHQYQNQCHFNSLNCCYVLFKMQKITMLIPFSFFFFVLTITSTIPCEIAFWSALVINGNHIVAQHWCLITSGCCILNISAASLMQNTLEALIVNKSMCACEIVPREIFSFILSRTPFFFSLDWVLLKNNQYLHFTHSSNVI